MPESIELIEILNAIFRHLENSRVEELLCVAQQLAKESISKKVIGIAGNENSLFIRRESFDVPAILVRVDEVGK